MAPLDPDPDPYWEYGSGSRTVKMVFKKGKKSSISSLKDQRPFCCRPDGFNLSLKVLNQCTYLKQLVTEKSNFLGQKFFLSFWS